MTNTITRPQELQQFGKYREWNVCPNVAYVYETLSGLKTYAVRYEHPTAIDAEGKRKKVFIQFSLNDEAELKAKAEKGLVFPFNYESIAIAKGGILLVEGEKTAIAAQKLFPNLAVITFIGGIQAYKKTDFSLLKDKEVIYWPDNDDAGRQSVEKLRAHLTGFGIVGFRVVQVPESYPKKWDLADNLPDGVSEQDLGDLLSAATPVHSSFQEIRPEDQPSKQQEPQPSKDPEIIASILLTRGKVWRDQDDNVYYGPAHSPSNLTGKNIPLESKAFSNLIQLASRVYKFFKVGDKVIPGAIVKDDYDKVRSILSAMAMDGPKHKSFIRIAGDEQTAVIDLFNDAGEKVIIRPQSIEVSKDAPFKLVHSTKAKPLPIPNLSGSLEELRPLLNCDRAEQNLILAWLVAAIMPNGPYAILILNALQGCGKSTLSRILLQLIDPNEIDIRAPITKEDDLAIACKYAHVVAFDNISSLSDGLSDALCRVSTGASVSKRQLYTNYDEASWSYCRPLILNGITDFVQRPDLMDRSIVITLNRLKSENRRSEEELKRQFSLLAPRILGGICTAAQYVLQHRQSHDLKGERPRMLEYAVIGSLLGEYLGWEDGEFLRNYHDNLKSAYTEILHSDAVASRISHFLQTRNGFSGKANELYQAITREISTDEMSRSLWPRRVQDFGASLKRIIPALEKDGWYVNMRKRAGNTIYEFGR